MKSTITILLACSFSLLSLSAHVEKKINDISLHILKGDIVYCEYQVNNTYDFFKADAIVNAANTKLARGGGVCGAIFAAAEGQGTVLQSYIQKQYPQGIATGQAICTPSFDLQKVGIQKIIHAVGPIYTDYSDKNEAKKLLASSYKNSLLCAQDHKLSSIAFPFISSGIYGYPKPEAAHVALESIKEFVTKQETTITDIYIVLNNDTDYELFVSLL